MRKLLGVFMMARLHEICPGPGNPHAVYSACHDPQFFSHNVTYTSTHIINQILVWNGVLPITILHSTLPYVPEFSFTEFLNDTHCFVQVT